MSLQILNSDIFRNIAIDLVEDPKSLVKFGKTCKLAYKVVQDLFLLEITVQENGVEKRQFLFTNVIALCKEEFAAKQVLSQLRGPSGFDGLVNQGYLELLAIAAAYPPEHFDLPDHTQEKLSLAFTKYKTLYFELSELAQFEGERIIGGKVYTLPIEIKNEAKKVQNKIKEGNL